MIQSRFHSVMFVVFDLFEEIPENREHHEKDLVGSGADTASAAFMSFSRSTAVPLGENNKALLFRLSIVLPPHLCYQN
jgi:hypothetical protein